MRLLLAALLLVLPGLAHAQAYRASILYVAPADSAAPLAYVARDSFEVPRQPSLAWPLLGGAVGGFAGMMGGLVVGASIDPVGDDISPGMAYGLLAGEMLFLPVGVHLGNGRKGNFLTDLAVSAAIGTTAVFFTSASNEEFPLILATAAQYGAVVAVERATAKSKIARATILAREAAIAAGPVPAGVDSLPPLHTPPLPGFGQPNPAWPISMGLVGGFAGGLAGAAVGAIASDFEEDAAPLIGFFVGESLFMPVGVHLGNAGNGSFVGDLGISLLGNLVSVGIGSIAGGGAGYAVGAAGTLAIAVANERAVGRRRLERHASAP